ncbi:AraC family transcriptional regulator [Peribacillus acanthi]|uniref:AraC family transcriptional regulator n=1 Tax=Peribacillus acanthi TaxID=2171554 RepID=UPI001300AB0A|nr:helix-turn-helix domain-containing protein [Peribacillus acanthi]
MKILETRLPNMSMALYQLPEKGADIFHDHSTFYQVSVPLIGNPVMQFYGESRQLSERAVTGIGEEHRNYTNGEAIRILIVSIQKDLVQSVYESQTGNKQEIEFARWGNNSSEIFKRLANRAFKIAIDQPLEELHVDELEWEVVQHLLTLQLGSHSVSWQKKEHVLNQPVLKCLLEYIHDNYREPISMDVLSTVGNISKMHMNRLFQAYVGLSPAKYITKLRVSEATDLLTNSNLDITTIAFASGFGSFNTFHRAFKEWYGMTPSEYKKAHTL